MGRIPRPPFLSAARLLGALLLAAVAALAAAAPEASGPDATRHFLRGTYQAGWVLQTNEYVAGWNTTGEAIRYVHSGRLEFGWQTAGSKDWHHLYGFPSYGLGLYTGNFSGTTLVGALTAVDGFFIWPFYRSDRFTVNGEFRLGVAEDVALFSPVDNPFAQPIAAGRSVYVDLGGSVGYRLSDRFQLLGGVTLAHFSNGATVQPNYDINTAAPFVSLQWDMEGSRPFLPRKPLPGYAPTWEFIAAVAGGVTNVAFATGDEPPGSVLPNENFGIANLTATLYRQLGWMSKVGAGLDVTYDGSAGAAYDHDTGAVVDLTGSDGQKLSLGVYAGYEHVVHRASALLQIGWTVLHAEEELVDHGLYQRLGIKYHVLDDTFLGLSARFTEFSRSQYLEWTLGQRWRW